VVVVSNQVDYLLFLLPVKFFLANFFPLLYINNLSSGSPVPKNISQFLNHTKYEISDAETMNLMHYSASFFTLADTESNEE